MKHVLFLLALLATNLSFSKETEVPLLQPDSIISAPNLDSTAFVHFHFPDEMDESGTSIVYSLDGIQGEYSLLSDNHYLSLETSAGWHNLQFYYSSSFYEEYVYIEVEAGNHYHYSIHFNPSEIMIMTEKPVIYLYPEQEQHVSVKVHPKGDFTFTYPTYTNGWEVSATPDGQLKIDDAVYNYLFWEASEQINPSDINMNLGFVVAGEGITEFLENTLTQAGLNGSERADFITFWAPRMAVHSDVFLQFHMNKECDRFGTLDITPKPDNVYRIYVVWQPVDQLRIAPTPQKIEPINRNGFTVLEWGGQELPSISNTDTF